MKEFSPKVVASQVQLVLCSTLCLEAYFSVERKPSICL